MGSLTRDDNFVPGVLLLGDSTSKDIQWKADETTEGAYVYIVGGSITADIEGDYTDDAAFTAGTSKGLAIGGIVTSDIVDSGDFGAFAMDSSRRQLISLEVDNVGLATSANQTTIIGHVDGIEALLATIDADTSSLAGTVSGSELQVDLVAITPDLMLGTDFSTVFGSASLISATPAVKVEQQGSSSVESDGTALGNGQVSVDTTAGGTTIVSASAGRQGAIITNQGNVSVFIGTGTITTSNGFELKRGESLSLPTDSEIKGITSSSSTTIGYLTFA